MQSGRDDPDFISPPTPIIIMIRRLADWLLIAFIYAGALVLFGWRRPRM
jgi:hypothetical protein